MGDETKVTTTDTRVSAKHRKRLLSAVQRYVATNRVTVCAMDPTLGYKGPACPVVNCYMRDHVTGKCLAQDAENSKASNKAMRDTMLVVEIIDKAREAPDWVTDKTYPAHGVQTKFADFIKEAGIEASKLQYVLDNDQHYSAIMNSVLKG